MPEVYRRGMAVAVTPVLKSIDTRINVDADAVEMIVVENNWVRNGGCGECGGCG